MTYALKVYEPISSGPSKLIETIPIDAADDADAKAKAEAHRLHSGLFAALFSPDGEQIGTFP